VIYITGGYAEFTFARICKGGLPGKKENIFINLQNCMREFTFFETVSLALGIALFL